MRDGTFFENLPCHLSEEEKHERGREAAAKQIELYEFKRLEKERAKLAKQKREELEKDIARLSQARHHGMEDQEVECYEQPNTTTYRIETIRTDTGEVVTSRKMDPMERQMAMQGELHAAARLGGARGADGARHRGGHERELPASDDHETEEPADEMADDVDDDAPPFKPLPAARDFSEEDAPVIDGDGFPEE